MLEVARGRGIEHVDAQTSPANLGSGRVLEKSGFIPVGTRKAALKLGDAMLDATEWQIVL